VTGVQTCALPISLITSLVGTDFNDGANILGNNLVTGTNIYFISGNILSTSVYFKYNSNNGWFWSGDKTNWMPVTTTTAQGGLWDGQQPVQAYKSLITSLVGKSLDDGKIILGITSGGAH
jgi:hypothetical protein